MVEAVECLHSWRKSNLIKTMQKQMIEELWDEDIALATALNMKENSEAMTEE
jgi:hypothetical protein